jgi:hypothetical protein
VPYRRGGTQCSKTDFSVNTFAKSLKQGAPGLPRDNNSDHAGSAQNLTVFSPIVLLLNPFQSFVLHGTVAGVITRPNNPRFVPVPIDFWSIETCYKRAPGDISHTNTRSNPMKTFYRTATPQITPLKTTHEFDLASVVASTRTTGGGLEQSVPVSRPLRSLLR